MGEFRRRHLSREEYSRRLEFDSEVVMIWRVDPTGVDELRASCSIDGSEGVGG